MPSIAQAQAKFLRNGGLNSLGQDPTASPTLGTVEAMLSLFAEEFIKKAKENLNKNNSTQSGKLEDSIEFQVTRMGTSYNMQLLVLDYYDFVNKGVQGKGQENKNRTSPYKFKFLNPSKSHVEAIKKWIKEGKKKITARDVKKYGRTKQESKAVQETNAAYAIAKSIKRRGLKATGFWDDAFKTFDTLEQKLGEALGVDISVDLNNLVRGIKKR